MIKVLIYDNKHIQGNIVLHTFSYYVTERLAA